MKGTGKHDRVGELHDDIPHETTHEAHETTHEAHEPHMISYKTETPYMRDHYLTGAVVGRGAFADVFRATRRGDGARIALKRFRRNANINVNKSFADEVRVLKYLDVDSTRWVVHMFEAGMMDKHTPAIAFALAEMSVREYMTRHRPNIAVRASIVEQLVRAVRCLHRQQIVHRDIKPDNLLLFDHGVLKMCDFGLARIVKSHDKLRTVCGSPLYMAAELFAETVRHGYDPLPVDVWSVGCVVYEVLHDAPAFSGQHIGALMLNVRRGRMNPMKPRLHFLFRRLIMQCIVTEPIKRATINILRIPMYVSSVAKQH